MFISHAAPTLITIAITPDSNAPWQVTAMTCLCCGKWRIEIINLDGWPRYKIMHGGHLASHDGYARTPEAVAAILRRVGGPDLANFTECS